MGITTTVATTLATTPASTAAASTSSVGVNETATTTADAPVARKKRQAEKAIEEYISRYYYNCCAIHAIRRQTRTVARNSTQWSSD